MFKLFVNNVQVGNYQTCYEAMHSLVMNYCTNKQCKSIVRAGKKIFVRFF